LGESKKKREKMTKEKKIRGVASGSVSWNGFPRKSRLGGVLKKNHGGLRGDPKKRSFEKKQENQYLGGEKN